MWRATLAIALGISVVSLAATLPPPQAGGPLSATLLRQPLAWDLFSYWSGFRLLRQGRNPYDPSNRPGVFGFAVPPNRMPNNPPWLFTLTAPILRLSFSAASLAWAVTGLASVVLATLLIIPPSSPGAARILALNLLAMPVIVNLHYGQSALLLLLGAAAFVSALSRGMPFAAGLAASLLTLKPHLFAVPATVTLLLLLRRPSWIPAAVGGFSIGLLLLALPPFLTNPQVFLWWLEHMATPSHHEWKTSTFATWWRLAAETRGLPSPPWLPWLPVALGPAVAILWMARKHVADRGLALPLASAFATAPLAAPYAWTYDFVLTLPLQCLFLAQPPPGRARLAWTLCIGFQAAAYTLKIALPEEHWHAWYPAAFCILVWSALRRTAPPSNF